MKYWVLAFYKFISISNPAEEVKRHKTFFRGKDITSRIYISEEGINGQMCAAAEDGQSYIAWMRCDPRFKDVEFKIHSYHEQVFPRITVKHRKQLVALDAEVDLTLTGQHLSAEQWSKMLETKDENTLLLDVRNDYEWQLGHFQGAELPKLETFREFPKYAKSLKDSKDPKKTKIMMYCTGGIRCELYSALLKQEGFEHVYQLDGGIIKYGLEAGTEHWEGKLFVFDDRMSVPLNDNQDATIISRCHFCQETSDLYFNCANMDCNALFIACLACAEKEVGCCCEPCKSSTRLRPFVKAERPKPFRRMAFTEVESKMH
jgi:UPF0176 protein